MEIWGALCPYGTYSVQSPENHTPMPLFRRSIPVIWLLAFGLLMIPQASARLYISEFLADNNDGLVDSDGDPSDWIELFNPGPNAVDLGGYEGRQSCVTSAESVTGTKRSCAWYLVFIWLGT